MNAKKCFSIHCPLRWPKTINLKDIKYCENPGNGNLDDITTIQPMECLDRRNGHGTRLYNTRLTSDVSRDSVLNTDNFNYEIIRERRKEC